MKILFMREQEGVYRFGSKRVYVKIDKQNQVLVRVGGGYMPVQDFLEQYTSSEVEKLRRKNAVDRFHNKIFLNKLKRD